jgi:hypothetical protein
MLILLGIGCLFYFGGWLIIPVLHALMTGQRRKDRPYPKTNDPFENLRRTVENYPGRENETKSPIRSPLEKVFGEKLRPLSDYCREPNGSYKRVVETIYEGEEVSTEDYFSGIFYDLVRLIGNIALPEDRIRDEDSLFLRSAASILHLPSKDWELDVFPEYIYFIGRKGWDLTVPFILLEKDLPDLLRVCHIYQALAEHITEFNPAARGKRRQGYTRVLEEIRDLLKQAVGIPKQEDNRYTVLKVGAGCSLDDLKAAYRREASLWHPDKLNHLAPELRERAEQQMTVINEAYQSLCDEYSEVN